MRVQIGKQKFIHPAARIIVENEKGEVLIVERGDNGKNGLPAGALEEGETIKECIIREVREETGIEIENLEVIGISSCPELETVQYQNGDVIQYFTIEFYSDQWTGEIKIKEQGEIKRAKWNPKKCLEDLPENEKSIMASLAYFRKEGKIRLG